MDVLGNIIGNKKFDKKSLFNNNLTNKNFSLNELKSNKDLFNKKFNINTVSNPIHKNIHKTKTVSKPLNYNQLFSNKLSSHIPMTKDIYSRNSHPPQGHLPPVDPITHTRAQELLPQIGKILAEGNISDYNTMQQINPYISVGANQQRINPATGQIDNMRLTKGTGFRGPNDPVPVITPTPGSNTYNYYSTTGGDNSGGSGSRTVSYNQYGYDVAGNAITDTSPHGSGVTIYPTPTAGAEAQPKAAIDRITAKTGGTSGTSYKDYSTGVGILNRSLVSTIGTPPTKTSSSPTVTKTTSIPTISTGPYAPKSSYIDPNSTKQSLYTSTVSKSPTSSATNVSSAVASTVKNNAVTKLVSNVSSSLSSLASKLKFW
jgi:hypothetical protein